MPRLTMLPSVLLLEVDRALAASTAEAPAKLSDSGTSFGTLAGCCKTPADVDLLFR